MQRIRFTVLLVVLAASFGCRRESVPPKRDPAAIAHGKQLFAEDCAICHGERGDGRGARGQFLDPRPPDFTSEQWQRAHPDEGMAASIRDGKHGTAMPSWRSLGEQQIRDLAAFVKSLG